MTQRRTAPTTRAHARQGATSCQGSQLGMVLLQLAQRQRSAQERSLRGLLDDPRAAYELFRRALVLRDQRAWEQVYACCHPQVEEMVRRCAGLLGDVAPVACLVSASFLHFYSRVAAAGLAAFPTLDALLEQLRRSAMIVALESARARQAGGRGRSQEPGVRSQEPGARSQEWGGRW